ncbi:MAG: hypothetical protein GZ088_04965 [Acidipila sp.]|nr:hypothetical protein [Acidipila sp.]
MAAFNYFNYFTEIEEYFWRKRGAQLLISPLDWAILESWQKAEIPLEAVQKGIDRAFESYARSRRGSGKLLKSLAYCVDAVMEAAAEAREVAVGSAPRARTLQAAEPFSRDELQDYLRRLGEKCGRAAVLLREKSVELERRIEEAQGKLVELTAFAATSGALDLEELERRLTALEDRLCAALTANADEEIVLKVRREMDRTLAPYRRKMSAEQLAMLEQQYLRRRLFEEYRLPRLSLFYFA